MGAGCERSRVVLCGAARALDSCAPYILQASGMEGPDTVRVRAREGDEVEWSRKAARRAGTLKDQMDDAPPDDDVYPAPAVSAAVLRALGELCEPDYVYPSSLEQLSVPELLSLVEGANFLAVDQTAIAHAQRALAARLNGKSAEALCAMLGSAADFDSAEERAAALAEPMFMPAAAAAASTSSTAGSPALQPQASLLGVSDDSQEMALAMVDVGTLAELKGVSRSWCELSRRMLCSRLCLTMGQPPPGQLSDVTALNVECLAAGSRLWEATVAGRLLANLTRLHGYGFEVDVSAVRATQLPTQQVTRGQPLGGRALRSCITPVDGEPPTKLLLAAVACAAQGDVWSIPVRQLRENVILGALDLSSRDLGPTGARLLSCLLPCATTLVSLKYATWRPALPTVSSR